MPELSRFSGMIIRMRYKDNAQHNKPHIHVHCDGEAASVAIDGEMLAGAIPLKQLKILRAWLIIHEDELYEAWNNAVIGVPFGTIAPLR